MAEPTKTELNKFVQTVDDFLAMKNKVASRRAEVYATNDPELISDYESFVSKADILQSTIESTVGAWNAAKAEYAKITDTTSTAIGDAIDEIRSWFGYDPAPGIGFLGIIQLPAAAWIAGIIAAAALLWRMGNSLMTRIDAATIARRENIPYSEALTKAADANRFKLVSKDTVTIIAGAALLAWYLWQK